MNTPRRSSPPLRSPEQRRGDPGVSTTTAVLRLGTRASALATTQSGLVADLIRERLGREVELVEVSTEGDRSAAPLATLGGTGVFVSALRDALLAGRGRRRRPLAQGPADDAGRRHRARRRSRCARTRATPSSPATA